MSQNRFSPRDDEFAPDEMTVEFVTPGAGSFTFETLKSVNYNNNATGSTIPGNQPGPKNHGGVKAEPSAELTTSKSELSRFRTWQGAGYMRRSARAIGDLVVTYTKGPSSDVPDIVDTVRRWKPVEGGTENSDTESSGTIGGKAMVVLLNGIEPFDEGGGG